MGKLITIDGLDGSGKQTQSEILLKKLQDDGVYVKMVSFPDYESRSSELVKMYLEGMFSKDPEAVNAYAASSFFAVDRYASYMMNWKEDYEKGAVIIANRYTTANAIHQLSKISDNGERKKFLDWLYDFEFVKLGIPSPDMTIFLDVPAEISVALIEKRSEETGRAIDIHENKTHLEKAHGAAMFSADELGWTRIVCAENGRMRTIDSIADEVYNSVKKIICE